jgi:endothelin-converting enzyme
MSLSDASKLAPVIGVDSIIKGLSPAGYSNDRVMASFLPNIQAISKALLSTSKETIQTYLMWRVIDQFSDNVYMPESATLRKLRRRIDGKVVSRIDSLDSSLT